MNKKPDMGKSLMVMEVDPMECPFREFRDNELSTEFWGMSPALYRSTFMVSKMLTKPPPDYVWEDDQTQPLPRSVRRYLNGWMRAEELAMSRWEAEVVVFEETNGGKMSVIDTQLTHTQVLMRSSFCRRVLSACFMLERVDQGLIEHQWENFMFSLPPEGWRPRFHIYSPGLKSGGGPQHRPGLSKNGCYLVRLYHLGAWRCVWVNDQVPVDATEAPLLPFSPLVSHTQTTIVKPGAKQIPTTLIANVVHLWPLLICKNVVTMDYYCEDTSKGELDLSRLSQIICVPKTFYQLLSPSVGGLRRLVSICGVARIKALLKLAAPDMNSDEETDCIEDEEMPEFNLMHALTGAMSLNYFLKDEEDLWNLYSKEVPVFTWDDDDETMTSTVKSRSTKKPTTKEFSAVRRSTITTILIRDTRESPPYALPGITPGHEMSLLVSMARDLPIKKPLPEPDVALWKYYRWVDWARSHGLYEAYECPRTRFLKVNGLMKLSYAPHLLDVQSTDSITFGFREENDKTAQKKGGKDNPRPTIAGAPSNIQQLKEELREWVQFNALSQMITSTSICYLPSMYQFTSAASHPPLRITKAPSNKALDIAAPKAAPLYLQVDGPDENKLRISLQMLHPRILFNSGVALVDYMEPAYLLVEMFEWFVDCEIPIAKAYIETRGYDSVEVKFLPGRHFCRIWLHSRMNWHLAVLSESTLLLGTRDLIQSAAVRECPWAARFLTTLGTAFTNWIRVNRSNQNVLNSDRDFYKSYQPDLTWDPEVVGYKQCLLHWMFRKALQALLAKRLPQFEFNIVCGVLRRYFCDPDFGLPDKPPPPVSVREMADADPCDCLVPEPEEVESVEEQTEEQEHEERPLVDPATMAQLLTSPAEPITSQVCELATEELPCGILKEEREKMIQKHEAATLIQAHWRGVWARKCLRTRVTIPNDVMKYIMENSFGNLEALSALMNQFFSMYPGAKYAYSVASALAGVYGLHQHTGIAYVKPKCKWIPYFQGVFSCHSPVKVHFDVQSTLQYSTVAIYDNDTGCQLPQVYNAHMTFDFKPNSFGFTVMGHGSLNQATGYNTEVHWQLTILSSINGAFHICDNEPDFCTQLPLPQAMKIHIDEMFIPNRRNILGGINITVTKHEALSFRAAATSPDLEMTAILRTTSSTGEVEELGRCYGTGELHWPYIRLEPPLRELWKSKSTSHSNLASGTREFGLASARSLKHAKSPKPGSAKNRSSTKVKDSKAAPLDGKLYTIQVIAPGGWPLTLQQWQRVIEVRNAQEMKVEIPTKKPGKEKEKEKERVVSPPYILPQPQLDDACVELECSVAMGGGAFARRDDERDLEFALARQSWDAREIGRNMRGAQIRREFRTEYLEAVPIPPSESVQSVVEEEQLAEVEGEEKKNQAQQGPTPVTESGLVEMTVEVEEETKYYAMPEQLKDKFVPLYFIPLCTKEKTDEESVLVTPDMAEAAKKDRHARIEAALERMNELQIYNEIFVLGRQKTRYKLVEKLYIDAQWNPELATVLEERDDAIAQELLNRTLSATKKKQDSKRK